ncbi:hypothetical protein BSKO_13270 [Bryopsis sp. KO-2023]|nr:hypothetical protein BSKO_13270 [Bryopsis sp. KO-2023]
MIKVATQAEISMICGEIIPFIGEMVLHPCGNYVIQNLITHGDTSIKKGLFEMLKNNMMYLTEDVCGCRVAQAAIQYFDEDDSTALARELDGNLTECIRSRNGNHVVQACIVHLPASRLGFMMDFFADKVKHLAVHPFGCRVLQRILEHCNDEKAKSKVIQAIIKDSEALAMDQYGNYILQHALVHGNEAERSAIVQEVAPKVVSLSCHKYASNPVEKCLAKGSTGDVNLLISSALAGEKDSEGVRVMAKDRFGNYVVQRMLKMADEAQRKDITSRLDSVEMLRSSPFGRAVAGFLERMDTTTTTVDSQN